MSERRKVVQIADESDPVPPHPLEQRIAELARSFVRARPEALPELLHPCGVPRRPTGKESRRLPDFRLARMPLGDSEQRGGQLLLRRLQQSEIPSEPDHGFTLRARTAAYLKYGCLLTGSHPVTVSSLAARSP